MKYYLEYPNKGQKNLGIKNTGNILVLDPKKGICYCTYSNEPNSTLIEIRDATELKEYIRDYTEEIIKEEAQVIHPEMFNFLKK